jgi:transposase
VKRGRITKLTKEVQQKIVDTVRAGNYLEVAAAYAGISENTLYEWIARGEGRDPHRSKTELYSDFAAAVKVARAEAEATAVAIVRMAMTDNWQAAMTFLERSFPTRWSRRTEVVGPEGGPLQVSITELAQLMAERDDGLIGTDDSLEGDPVSRALPAGSPGS